MKKVIHIRGQENSDGENFIIKPTNLLSEIIVSDFDNLQTKLERSFYSRHANVSYESFETSFTLKNAYQIVKSHNAADCHKIFSFQHIFQIVEEWNTFLSKTGSNLFLVIRDEEKKFNWKNGLIIPEEELAFCSILKRKWVHSETNYDPHDTTWYMRVYSIDDPRIWEVNQKFERKLFQRV